MVTFTKGFVVVCLLGCIEGAPEIPDLPFESAKWRQGSGSARGIRAQMVMDLLRRRNELIEGKRLEDVIELLGEPYSRRVVDEGAGVHAIWVTGTDRSFGIDHEFLVVRFDIKR